MMDHEFRKHNQKPHCAFCNNDTHYTVDHSIENRMRIQQAEDALNDNQPIPVTLLKYEWDALTDFLASYRDLHALGDIHQKIETAVFEAALGELV